MYSLFCRARRGTLLARFCPHVVNCFLESDDKLFVLTTTQSYHGANEEEGVRRATGSCKSTYLLELGPVVSY